MAKSKKPTSAKKVRYQTVKSWNKPQFKLLYLVLFALIFGWVGYRVFFAHAATPFPTGSDEIVAQLQSLDDTQLRQDPDTKVASSLMRPGDVIVAGDGTLYCNTSSDGSTTTAQLGNGELKQLFDSVNGSEVHGLAKGQDISHVDITQVPNLSVLIVNAADHAQVIYNSSDTTGVFARTAAKLQQRCSITPPQKRVNTLPDFKPVSLPANDSSVSAKLRQILLPSAYADYASTPNCTSTLHTNCFNSGGGMASDINGHRASYNDSSTNRQPYTYESNHPPITLDRRGCIDTVARKWAYYMGTHNILQHNPNFVSQIAGSCKGKTAGYTTDWTSLGEDVGEGPSENSVFGAFLSSPCHHENIDARDVSGGSTCGFAWTYAWERYKYFGVGSYTDARGITWYAVNFANWY